MVNVGRECDQPNEAALQRFVGLHHLHSVHRGQALQRLLHLILGCIPRQRNRDGAIEVQGETTADLIALCNSCELHIGARAGQGIGTQAHLWQVLLL